MDFRMVRFIGDVHGKFTSYKKIIKDVPFSIQVGDMGVGFRRNNGDLIWSSNPPYDAMSKGKHLFIRGNHDNPEICKKQKFWIEDGSSVKGIFCLGGATSIDKAYRTQGIDWWPDEELSYLELERLIDKYISLKPKIVCTHECPESVANEILSTLNKIKIKDGSRTRQALEVMFHHHQPEYWVFGHWHTSLRFQRGRTIFQCLNELEYVDIDTHDYL